MHDRASGRTPPPPRAPPPRRKRPHAAPRSRARQKESEKVMAQNGTLKLELVDVYGKRLQEKVDISLRHTKLSQSLFFKSMDASKLIQINGLFTSIDGPYQISIDPPSYHHVSQFLNVKTSGVTDKQIMFPVDASKVVSVNFPKFAGLSKEGRTVLTHRSNVFGFQNKSGSELYDAIGVDNIK